MWETAGRDGRCRVIQCRSDVPGPTGCICAPVPPLSWHLLTRTTPARPVSHSLRQKVLEPETISYSLNALSLRVLTETDKHSTADATDDVQTSP